MKSAISPPIQSCTRLCRPGTGFGGTARQPSPKLRKLVAAGEVLFQGLTSYVVTACAAETAPAAGNVGEKELTPSRRTSAANGGLIGGCTVIGQFAAANAPGTGPATRLSPMKSLSHKPFTVGSV